MASGLVALLDDVAAIAKIAATSLDDVTAAASKAGTKAVGVVIDDAAVTPGYAVGFTPDRELPIVWKIALGSLGNKFLLLLPCALLLSAFAPWAVTPILMVGAAYLCFEAAEKMLGHFIKKAHRRKSFVRPRVVIGVPSEITQVERRAVKDSAYRAKAS